MPGGGSAFADFTSVSASIGSGFIGFDGPTFEDAFDNDDDDNSSLSTSSDNDDDQVPPLEVVTDDEQTEPFSPPIYPSDNERESPSAKMQIVGCDNMCPLAGTSFDPTDGFKAIQALLRILFIAGPVGAGKSTLAAKIQAQMNTDLWTVCINESFANTLYYEYCDAIRLRHPKEFVTRIKTDPSFKQSHYAGLNALATERLKEDPDYFVKDT